jgi:hypothetical protein
MDEGMKEESTFSMGDGNSGCIGTDGNYQERTAHGLPWADVASVVHSVIME